MDKVNSLILELYRAAKETPVDEFQELALAFIKVQTPFRTAVWGYGEKKANGFSMPCVHLHNEPPEIMSDLTSCNSKSSIIIDTVLANSGRVFIYNSPLLFEKPGCAEIRDYTLRYGHVNNMTITTASLHHPNGQWLSLYRDDKHEHFCPADGKLLEQVMPHLVEALEINRMIGKVPSALLDSGTAGTRAIARSNGTLYHCGRKFSDLLLEIWPEWKGGVLPAELMGVLYPGREAILSNHSMAVSTAMLGDLLMLTIRKISPLHILSQRELEVAKLYAQGDSYKEIGLMLDIAPSTVRNFLGRIYAKLGINSKIGLISLLSN